MCNVCEAVEWSAVPSVPALGRDDIHLWRGRLAVDESVRVGLAAALSDDERERAGRFRFDPDRNRYVVARGMLRHVLGRYLDDRPERLRFHYGPQGKPVLQREHSLVREPSLVPEQSGPALDFNVSHSGELAVLAVGRGRRVGVDVEKVRVNIAAEKIAERFFSHNEVRSLRSLRSDERDRGFFRCWTRKEAYVKACGEGLQIALDSFDVTLAPGLPARFIRGVDPSWQLVSFTAAPGYPGALAYDGAPAQVSFLCADQLLQPP
jgi:4'-phosphopantetheinyl transferase